MTRLICKWCGEEVGWSRLLDKTFCSDCRCDDVIELDEGEDTSDGDKKEI
jgi:hypothetical protein